MFRAYLLFFSKLYWIRLVKEKKWRTYHYQKVGKSMTANNEAKSKLNRKLIDPLNNDERGFNDKYEQQEALALYHDIQAALKGVGKDNRPFISCSEEITEFDSLQKTTTEKLLAMEKELYKYGLDAGVIIFKEALHEFFYLERENLLEMESEGTVFFDTFRNNHLLDYGQSFFSQVAEYFYFQGIPSKPELLHSTYGSYTSNTLYPLYTFLYEDASKERKRAIQSILQQHGITVKDLKKCSRVKSN